MVGLQQVPLSFTFFLQILASRMFIFFFFNDTATTEIYTLSLHDALPILHGQHLLIQEEADRVGVEGRRDLVGEEHVVRSGEHTSELQSHLNLVCRLLLEKKKQIASAHYISRATLPCSVWACMSNARAPPS